MPSSYPGQAPVGVDTTRASVARVYDAALNGKDNFQIDRDVLDQVRTVAPGVCELAWANRDFLTRACRFLAKEARIDQYLDLGSGLPTAENTHQVVQRAHPDAQVIYVDNDPMVLAHARALLGDNDRTLVVEADIFRPFDVMTNRVVRQELDLSRPVAVFQVGTLQHYLGDDVATMMKTYIAALPAGSYVVISHFFDPETPEHGKLAHQMEQKFLKSPMGSGRFRTRREIQAMFGDLEMVEPGLVLCDDWWPDGPRFAPLSDVRNCIACGIGRKR
ncbi:MAG: hypothetical protein HOQ24_11920 [Mycobacteriaceae bacterium]|nr:hypothetical protein [Mycobacteriaceae bacterium]